MEYGFPEVVNDCMARVVASLEADYIVGLLGQKIYDAALTFIAPLGADNGSNSYVSSLVSLGSLAPLW